MKTITKKDTENIFNEICEKENSFRDMVVIYDKTMRRGNVVMYTAPEYVGDVFEINPNKCRFFLIRDRDL